jgi:hypothetical protein
VRRQIDRGTRTSEASDRVQSCAGNPIIYGDAICFTGEHQLLVVRGVSSQKERGAVIVPNDYRDMIRGPKGQALQPDSGEQTIELAIR